MRLTSTTRLPALLRAALAALLLAVPALAADGPGSVQEARDRALAAVASDGNGIGRAKEVAALAAFDDLESAKAFVECVAALAKRQTETDAIHQQTLKAYEPYQGYDLGDRKDWELKRRLQDQLEQEDEKLQGLATVAQAARTAVTKLQSAGAIGHLEKSGFAQSDAHGRWVLLAGLVGNPAAKGPEIAKKALKDEAPLVRIGIFDAIRARRDAAFLDVAATGLKEQGWPARQAAIRAIGAMRTLKAVPLLVGAMQQEEGALLEDFAAALTAITGQTLGNYPEVWHRWYEDHKEELAADGVTPTNTRPSGRGPARAMDYYGIETLSRRVLFVIDVSGSMHEPIGGTEEITGVSGAQNLTGIKIEIAKRVLTDAVHKLDKEATFNIVFFNHQVRTFQEAMVKASDDMKAKADVTILDIQPSGSTWAYGALRKCFELCGVTGDPVKGKFDPRVDTIFFLSDGAPTDDGVDDAKLMDPDVILKAVHEWNRVAGIRIHTIAIDPRLGKGSFVRFMKGLAADNAGTYTAIGDK